MFLFEETVKADGCWWITGGDQFGACSDTYWSHPDIVCGEQIGHRHERGGTRDGLLAMIDMLMDMLTLTMATRR